MSWRSNILNLQLRLMEKPRLARVSDPAALRRQFERNARLLFRAPRGTARRETEPGGVPALELTVPGAVGDAVLFYIHGGGFVFGSPRTHSAMAARLAQLIGGRACLPRYRLAPENGFPDALDDVTAAYAGLIEQGVSPGRIVIGGDSAGGCLALALLARILRRGMAPPCALFAFSPLTDLTFSGESFLRNAATEAVLPARRAGDMAALYLRGADPLDPRVSPLFADFNGAPPVWLTVGDREILLDDSRRMAARMRAQGVAVTCEVASNLPHVWPIFHNILPEADRTLRDLAAWIRPNLSSAGS